MPTGHFFLRAMVGSAWMLFLGSILIELHPVTPPVFECNVCEWEVTKDHSCCAAYTMQQI